jgi:hypothetical protein
MMLASELGLEPGKAGCPVASARLERGAALNTPASRVLPPAKSIAGGNRARGREPQPIKNKVDTVDTVDTALRRLTHTVPGPRASGLTWEVP